MKKEKDTLHCFNCGRDLWGHVSQLLKYKKGKRALFCLKCAKEAKE